MSKTMLPFEEIVSGVPLASAARSVLMLIVPEPLSRRKVPPVQASESAAVEMVRMDGVNKLAWESGRNATLLTVGTARARVAKPTGVEVAGVNTALEKPAKVGCGAATKGAAVGKTVGLVPETMYPGATVPVASG